MDAIDDCRGVQTFKSFLSLEMVDASSRRLVG
jgi:hypothetical protein